MTRLQDRFRLIAAVYIIFRDDGKILLLKRAGSDYMNGYYSLPSGHFEGGETAISAAIRESKEEVGVDIKPENLKLVLTMHRRSTDPVPHERIDLYFEATEWTGEPHNAEPHKCDQILWSSVDDFPKKVLPEVRQALAMIAKNEPYSDMNFSE